MSIEITDEVTKDVAEILYTGYASSNVPLDSQKIYKLYKEGHITDLGAYRADIEVLELLCSLGFSINHPGTCLFKDLVLKILYTLASGDKMTREQLKEALEEPFSAFYFDLARNELDLGIKSFHEIVSDACDNRDGNNADPELLALFEGVYEQSDFATLAMSVCDFVRVGAQKTALGL